jgi:hypothetical protein
MGKVIKSVFKPLVGAAVGFFTGGGPLGAVAGAAGGFMANKAAKNKRAAQQQQNAANAAQSAQVQEYQAALGRQQADIAAEHSRRTSELEAATKRTQEGQMRANRARRQGGIFTEAQSTVQQAPGGSLG